MVTTIEGSSTFMGKSQTEEGILILHQTVVMIQPP